MTPHVAEIQAVVCERFGLTLLDLTSQRNGRTYAQPRQLAMYLARELTQASLPSIGKLFGDRDHSTVIHAIRVTEKRIAHDRDFADIVAGLRFRIAHPGQPPLPLEKA